MRHTFSISAVLIRVFADLYSGCSFNEVSQDFRDIWQRLVIIDERVNPLEYE